MVQVLPSDDSFAAGTPAYGSELIGYIGCAPSTIAFPFFNYTTGVLHNGYGNGTAAFAEQLGNADSFPCGAIWRAAEPTHCKTSLVSFMSGSTQSQHMTMAGVMCRVQGGTLAGDGTTDVRYQDVNGYGLVARGDVSGAQPIAEFRLLKWSSGQETTLGLIPDIPLVFTNFDFSQPFTLDLEVQDTLGGVVLRPRISNFVLNGAPVGTGFLLSDFMIALGGSIQLLGDGIFEPPVSSPHTTAGRSGLIMSSERVQDGNDVVQIAQVFQIEDVAAGTVEMRDEFLRVGPIFSLTVSDQFGVAGFSMQSSFYHDQHHSDLAGALPEELGRDGDRLEVNAATASETKAMWALSQRPADDSRSQARSASIEFSSSGTATAVREAGIALRASGSGTSVWTGYAAVCVITSTNDRSIEIRRYNGDTWANGTVLAKLADASSKFSEGSAFTFSFEVYPLGDTPDSDGPAQLLCKVGGAAVAVTAEAEPGVTDNGAGLVTDAGDDRITQGAGEGFHLYHQAGTRAIYLDTWTQETLTDPITGPEDQASVVVLGEGTSSGQDLATNLQADLPLTVRYDWDKQVTTFETGHAQAFPIHTDSRRTFSYTKVVDQTQLDLFEAFWSDHADGTQTPFSWSLPSDAHGPETIKACFAGDSYALDYMASGTWRITAEITELV